MSKKSAEQKAAEAHDAAIRELIQSQEPGRQDKITVLIALGFKLPESPLTATEKKRIKKRADKIICDALVNLIDGGKVDFEMRGLAREWLLQLQRGRGRPNIQKGLIIEAVCQEYAKGSGRMHKQIIGAVGDRVGLETERMKQIAKSGRSEINKIVKRLADKSKRK